jgi:hypothetical protein
MFTPLSKMSATLQAHLRYPEDIFSIQSAIYGRYHLTPSQFYSASNSWQLSPTAGAGPKSQALSVDNTYNSQGELVSQNPARMAPLYQVFALPHSTTQAFTITDAFVPASQSNVTGNGQNYNLTAFMVGDSDPGHYGDINVYETPPATTGPANADAEIDANTTVSKDISLLDQKGSEVLLGNTLLVPVGQSVLYLRPLYVAASTNPQPTLSDVIGVLGKDVQIQTSLSATLTALFKTNVSISGTGSSSGVGPISGTVSAAVQADLDKAQAFYVQAQAALQSDNLGAFGSDITAMEGQVAAAQKAAHTSTSSTTTTTTVPHKSKSKSTSSTPPTSTTTTTPK